MSKLGLGLAVIAFITGVITAPFVMGAAWMFRGSVEQNCLKRDICVGDEARSLFVNGRIEESIGGLTLRICGEGSEARYDFISSLIEGEACSQDRYALEFRDQSARTLVSVRNGRIERITRGPLHIIDF